ncbi:MAG: hypothetical protein NTZ90_15200 [Proteobacteria bacterium]|nr:hypothetical protein [Pseudomonadota bacterium]
MADSLSRGRAHRSGKENLYVHGYLGQCSPLVVKRQKEWTPKRQYFGPPPQLVIADVDEVGFSSDHTHHAVLQFWTASPAHHDGPEGGITVQTSFFQLVFCRARLASGFFLDRAQTFSAQKPSIPAASR